MRLYNTLTKKIEEFKPINPPKVSIYGCGPTVYERQHVGNYRTYILYDIVARIFCYLGYDVKNVMNYTDVGHLTMTDLQRNEAEKRLPKLEDTDEETGVDKLEKQAKKEGLTPFQIAGKYIQYCETDLKKLNFIFPTVVCRATDYIQPQIDLIKRLEKKGYVYVTPEAVYFDVEKYNQEYKNSYFELAGDRSNDQMIAVREKVIHDKSKKHPMDFRLWQLNQPDHAMLWDSPWGKGYPGWHIECSAMALTNLGNTIDIHMGGLNLIFPHHTNEIAQSQGATGKQFSRFWLHGANLTVYNKKMGKSLGNAYSVNDVEQKGIDPLALRLLYFQTHYQTIMNFTWESALAAQESLDRLRQLIISFKQSRFNLSSEKLQQVDDFRQKFFEAISNNLDMPRAISVMWEVAKSNIPNGDKLDLLYEFDQVLGLRLNEVTEEKIPEEIVKLAQKRQEARLQKDFKKADELRKKIEEKGFTIEDVSTGFKIHLS